MRSASPARLIVAIFVALALTTFVNARAAYAQDATDSGTSVDASWERTGPTAPAIDEDAASADGVLEIPQVTCANDGTSGGCDSPDDDGTQAVNAPSPGSPPTVFDDDTAGNDTPDQDWGTVDEYQNEQVYAVPYAVYPSQATVARRPSPLPPSAYIPTSGPLTQAARPPLNPGPWMTPSSMSAFGRPAGSPMAGMTMSSPAWGFPH
ncbi:MAG: hypothetical protein ACREQH_09295 [Candidatus Binatus sp.]